MNPQEMQVDNMPQDPNMAQRGQEMTPDEAAASLAFATSLQEDLLKQQNPVQEEMTEAEPIQEAVEVEQEEEVTTQMTEMEDRIMERLNKIEKGISSDDDELESLKEEINKALNGQETTTGA